MNRLLRFRKGKNYLEIGVAQGDTFKGVHAERKTGVDPAFDFDIKPWQEKPGHFLFDTTSDIFFENYKDICVKIYREAANLDLIYIDGLHTYEQALRDFLNSQQFTGPQTLWVFDDTIPCDPWSAIPDMLRSLEWRERFGVPGAPWHGDVYKCVLTLHDFYPEFSYATIADDDNPRTVVWKTDEPARRKPVFGDREAISNLDYFDALDNFPLFNPVRDADLLNVIGKKFEDSSKTSDIDVTAVIRPMNRMKIARIINSGDAIILER